MFIPVSVKNFFVCMLKIIIFWGFLPNWWNLFHTCHFRKKKNDEFLKVKIEMLCWIRFFVLQALRRTSSSCKIWSTLRANIILRSQWNSLPVLRTNKHFIQTWMGFRFVLRETREENRTKIQIIFTYRLFFFPQFR